MHLLIFEDNYLFKFDKSDYLLKNLLFIQLYNNIFIFNINGPYFKNDLLQLLIMDIINNYTI